MNMKALLLEDINYPLKYKDVINPKPRIGYQIIEVNYAAINHRDVWINKGLYADIKTPIILGSDLCGEINGQEVVVNPGWKWGSNESYQSNEFEVLGMPQNGSFAQQISVPDEYIFPKPVHLTRRESAALPLAGLTAFRALITRAQLKPKDRLLITGIGGGVSLMGLKLAVAMGVKTFVTSGSDEKIAKAIALGATGGVNYKSENWHKVLREKVGKSGFDVILDSAGGEGFGQLLKLTNYGARIAIYGGTRGNYKSVNPQIIFWKQISILGSTMGSDFDFKNMLEFVSKYKVCPVIDKVYDLEDGNLAFERMSKGDQFGKIILKIN